MNQFFIIIKLKIKIILINNKLEQKKFIFKTQSLLKKKIKNIIKK